MSDSITLWASSIAIFAFCAFCYGCFGGLLTHFDFARWSLLFQSQSSVQQASRRQQSYRQIHQAERGMNQARRRQREIELADQNAAASPIPAPSNFLEERRTFYQMRNHDGVLSLEDLELLIPSGTVVKDEDSTSGENRLAVDFGNDDFSCIDDNHDHCIICLEDWKDGDQIRRSTFCTHVFHSECMFSWMKQSHDCPSCRTRVLPEGYTVNLVGEEYEEVNNSNWDSVGIPSAPGGMTATTHFLQYGTATTYSRNTLFPSFLPMEQRRTFLEDLLIVGTIIHQSESSLEVSFMDCPSTKILPLVSCRLCSGDWSVDDAVVVSGNPSCPHYYHKECIVDRLIHGSSDCPGCQRIFIVVDGDYDDNRHSSVI